MPAPIFNRPSYDGTVSENVPPGAVLGTVQANDPDLTGITYSIASGGDDNLYAVAPTTGEVTTTFTRWPPPPAR